MKPYLALLIFLLFSLHAVASDTLAVNTTWRGTVAVNEDLIVGKGATLTILPGTEIYFGENIGLTILGDLAIKGQVNNPVLLSTRTAGWSGIAFLGASGEAHHSEIDFGIIEKVSNVGIYLETYAPLYVDHYDQLSIRNSIIRYNKAPYTGGIQIVNSSTHVYKTLIYRNAGECGAVDIRAGYGDTPVIENCTIAYNTNGSHKGVLAIEMSQLHSPEYDAAATSFPTSPKFRNCIIWGDKNIVTGGIAERYFEHCIVKGTFTPKEGVATNVNPLFVGAVYDDYRLNWDGYPRSNDLKSPAIDAAHFNTPNDPDGSPADIGALPFNQAQSVFGPKANFSSENVRGQAPFNVVFINHSSPGTNKDLAYLWDFGDGQTSAEVSPQHVYQNKGTYTVSLTVTDKSGLKATLELPGYIKSGTAVKESKVEGVWTRANSPYLIYNDINVDSTKSLLIEPGVEVEFQGEYELNVYGKLQALGTAKAKILFHAKDTASWTQMGYLMASYMEIPYKEGWGGINILDTSPLDTTRLSNCIFQNVGEFGRRSSHALPGYRKYSFFPPQGALVAYKTTQLEIDSCTFASNFVSPPIPASDDPFIFFYGNPGITLAHSSGKITNCTFTDNLAHDGQIVAVYNSKVEIAYNTIYNNRPGIRTSLLLKSSDASVHHNVIHHTAGGGISISGTHSLSDDITPRYLVYDNLIRRNSQGISVSRTSAFVHIYNNWILENKGAYEGAGVFVDGGSKVYVTGNVIAYNENNQKVSNGGAGYYGGGKVIANNTIYGNRATNMGGAGLYTGTSGLIANNIIYGNFSWGGGAGNDYVFYQYDPTDHYPDATLKNNLIGTDPSFELQDSLDFSLKPGSVAIDRGTQDTAGLHLPSLDILGLPRVDSFGSRVDVGAFEFRTSPSAPSDISLSSRQVVENQAFIGKLSVEDIDKDDSHEFHIVGQENSRFAVTDSSLYLSEGESAYFDSTEVTIRAVDTYGLSIEKQFTIRGVQTVTSSADQQASQVLRLRPNPVKDYLAISLIKPATIIIYSITGKKVRQEKLQAGENQVDLRLLPPGVYVVDFTELHLKKRVVKY